MICCLWLRLFPSHTHCFRAFYEHKISNKPSCAGPNVFFLNFSSSRPSQQFFSHVGMVLPELPSTKQRIKCHAK